MPDDEYRTKYSAAQKMQLLKSQQAKLEIRAMPVHSQLKLKAYDKKMKKKRKKKLTKKKSRRLKSSLDAADSSSSSRSKKSLASTGSGAAMPKSSSSHKGDAKFLASKDEQENVLKWKRRTEYIYEAERIAMEEKSEEIFLIDFTAYIKDFYGKLKEIAMECEKDIELRVTMDDIAAGMDTLKKTRDEYYQYVQTQNDIFDKQIKLLNEFQTMQIAELTNKVRRLSDTFKNIDSKLSVISTKLQNITSQQLQKTPAQNFIEAICKIF